MKGNATAAVSFVNRFFSIFVALVLGVFGGFAIFHSALQYRLEQTQYEHNETLEIFRNNYFESEKERKQCVETDGGRLQEINDLRGRLDAQENSWRTLSTKQRKLLLSDGESKEQLQKFREDYERDQKTLVSLRAELNEKDRELSGVQKKLVAVQGELQMQRKTEEAKKREEDSLKGQLKQKDRQIEGIEQSLRLLGEQKDKLERESREVRKIIQQKDQELQKTKKDVFTLEKYVAEVKGDSGKLESQIVEKDKEIFAYREEEGNLQEQLVNFREGMLELIKEKIQEIDDLERGVSLLKQEKVDLEAKLENWREGMLRIVKEKMEEIDHLKAALAEHQESTEHTMKEVELAREDQTEAEEFMRIRLDIIDQNDDVEKEELMRELMNEVETVREQLKESRDWVVAVTKDLEHRKEEQAKTEEEIKDKEDEIDYLKSEIEKAQENTKQKVSELQSNLAEAQKLVDEKTKEIERLNSELGVFVSEVNDLKSVSVPGITTSDMMIKHVQQRDGMICRQLFGKGPYYVKFVVKLPPSESDGDDKTVFFVIELSSRKELPHSTYTLVTLVESRLYDDGAAFLWAHDDGSLRITSSNSPGKMSLEQKLKPLGLTDGSSLSFIETPSSKEPLPCGDFSVGFIQRGPGLNLFLPGKDEGDNQTGCLAQVIRGQESLQKIRSLLLETGEPMEIVSVKHLRVD